MNKNTRCSKYKISPTILKRWSPRSFTGEKISQKTLLGLFEAARWAPSSYNNQPWRFIYAERDTKHWTRFFNLLVEFNQKWAKNAAVLAVIISSKKFEHNGKKSRTHAFDAGSAWENLALEAKTKGWVAHAMEGFDYKKARKELKIPDDFEIHAMIAIGKQDRKENLPKDLQEQETMSDRKSLSEIIMEGIFTKNK